MAKFKVSRIDVEEKVPDKASLGLVGVSLVHFVHSHVLVPGIVGILRFQLHKPESESRALYLKHTAQDLIKRKVFLQRCLVDRELLLSAQSLVVGRVPAVNLIHARVGRVKVMRLLALDGLKHLNARLDRTSQPRRSILQKGEGAIRGHHSLRGVPVGKVLVSQQPSLLVSQNDQAMQESRVGVLGLIVKRQQHFLSRLFQVRILEHHLVRCRAEGNATSVLVGLPPEQSRLGHAP